MIKDIRRSGKKFINCSLDSSAKIRNEDLDFYAFLFLQLLNAFCKMRSSSVFQVIPVDTGDDDIFKF